MTRINNKYKLKMLDFHPISYDLIFKSLWLNGGPNTKNFFYRLINRLVGYDVSDFTFYYNELPVSKYNVVFNRIDIILVSKDKSRRVNIELNRKYKKSLMNRNESYLYRIAGNFYNSKEKDSYEKPLLVDQVNLNCFESPDNKALHQSTFTMKDQKNNLDLKSIRIINVYLPTLSIKCYNEDEEAMLDYKMFMAQSFEEMAQYVKGNKERMSVLKTLEQLMAEDENYMTDEERLAFAKAMEREVRIEEYKKGLKRGKREGRKEAANIINKLLSSGMSKEELSKRLDIPIDKLCQTKNTIKL